MMDEDRENRSISKKNRSISNPIYFSPIPSDSNQQWSVFSHKNLPIWYIKTNSDFICTWQNKFKKVKYQRNPSINNYIL